MKKTSFLAMLILSAILMSCGDSATNKIVKELNSSYDNEGKEVELTGYITVGKVEIVRDNTIGVSFVSSPTQQSQHAFAHLTVQFGKESNRIWLPEKFRLQDVEIYDSKGEKHNTNTQLTVKGTLHYTHKNWEKDLVVEELTGPLKNNSALKKMKEDSARKNQEAAEKRKKETGDPNDYSFDIHVQEISVAK
jgi:hypothetical protein